MANLETSIEREIMVAASEDGLLAYHQYHGKYCPYYSPKTVIEMGIPGMADLNISPVPVMVTQAMVGKYIGIAANCEVKTPEPGSVQSGAQVTYQQIYENRGGIYIVARSPEEYRTLLAARITAIQAGKF